MGGRSGAFRKSGGEKIPTEPRVMDEAEYLAKHGVASPLNDDDAMGRVRNNAKLQGSFNVRLREQKKLNDINNKYHDKREKYKAQYAELVKSGKVRSRTEPEKAFRTAQGNSENRSVKAARRILTKRGIDWKTGKRIKGFTGRGYPEIDPKTGIEKRR